MFLTSSPVSLLSDDIGKTGSVSQKKKKTVFSLAAVNACALTGCAHDNNPACGAHSIIGIVHNVQLQ